MLLNIGWNVNDVISAVTSQGGLESAQVYNDVCERGNAPTQSCALHPARADQAADHRRRHPASRLQLRHSHRLHPPEPARLE